MLLVLPALTLNVTLRDLALNPGQPANDTSKPLLEPSPTSVRPSPNLPPVSRMLESQKDDWCRVARKSVPRLAYWFSFSNEASRCVMVHMIEYLGLHVLMIFSKALRNVEATENCECAGRIEEGEASSVAPGARSSQLLYSGNQSPSAQSQRSSKPLAFKIFAFLPVEPGKDQLS